MTHELDGGLSNINNGVNHMRLDNSFIESSNEWGGKFDREALNNEKARTFIRHISKVLYVRFHTLGCWSPDHKNYMLAHRLGRC